MARIVGTPESSEWFKGGVVAVGTVFVGFAGPEGVESFELRLEGDPSEIRAQAVDFALGRIGSMTQIGVAK